MEERENKVYILRQEELDKLFTQAASIGAQTALESLEKEKKKLHSSAASRKLHNTKLLLRNYRMLKEHTENSVYGRSQMKASAADILESMMDVYDDEVIVDSIKRSATRTAIMVAHIDKMLDLYKTYCDKSFKQIEKRRYEVIYDMYIKKEPMTAIAIAKKHHMSKENVYSDRKIALESLSALLFGVDGLNAQ